MTRQNLLTRIRLFVTFGLNGRQWLSSMIIATLLIPITAPISVSATIGRGESAVNAEITEPTSFLTEISNEVEAFTTPWRAENSDDTEKKGERKAPTVEKAVGLKEPEAEHVSSENKSEVSVEPSTERNTVPEVKAHSNLAPPPVMFNQLPDSEHQQLYSYGNNLGSPRGQVEADSANRAAATRIRHRSGIANFSFDVPLASLSGRGLNAGIGMTYNSRTWAKTYDGTGDHYSYDVEESLIAPGFSAGLGYVETRSISNGLVDNDGTRREFACTVLVAGTCTEYTTNDGSLIKQYTHALSGGYTTEIVLKFPNGSKIFYKLLKPWTQDRKYFPYRIVDSNGNVVRVEYKDDKGRIDYIKDTLNRQIKFYYENDVSSNPDKLVAVTIPGMTTSSEIQTVRFYYETLTLNSSGKFTGTITAPATIRVLKYVYMPATQTGYKYDYDTNYGMIRKISRYVGMTASSTATNATGTITSDGLFATSTEYNYPNGLTALTDVPKYSKRTDDWNGRTGTAQETFYDAPTPSPGADYYSNITVKDNGFDVLTQTISNSNGFLKESSVWKMVGSTGTLMSKTAYTFNTTTRNLTRIEVTNDSGLIKATEFEYDGYNNQTKVRECGYAATGATCTDANALRRTETTYETGSGWINANLISLPKTVKTIVGGTVVSKTALEYDHNGSDSTLTRRTDIDTTGTHDVYYNPSYPAGHLEEVCPESGGGGCTYHYVYGYEPASAYRGNVTKVTRFSDATLTTDTNADVSDYEYDITGNLVTATLSCCNVKALDYGSAFSVTGYAWPVSETKGSTPTTLATSATYNYNTGLALTSTNENNQTTTYEYESDTLRPKKTIYPNGGYVETDYSDKLVSGSNLLPGFVRQTTTLDATHTAQSYSYFDARGLGFRSASQTPDGWLISSAEYDNLGRMRKSYNPFYGSTPVAALPTGTKYSEVTAIDALGRTTGVTLQDNTTVSTAFSTPAGIPTGFNKTWVSVTDQAGKIRRQVMDALGRIVRVDEPDTNGSLGAVDASLPAQQTSYEYDGNDNLSKVIQSDGSTTQNRRFKYDSLSRLVAEYQVEANATLDLNGTKGTVDNVNKWSKVLKYSVHGLLTDGYDARGVRTQMAYDGLNRVSSVTYTGETGYQTPTVTYTYDQARSGFYNTGALTKVETAASGDTPSTKTEFDYDAMGRVSKHRQWIGTQQYDLEYGYNLAGQLISEKYPSGRVVTNSYDANGRLSGIADASRTYLSNLQYQGNGGSLSSMTYGNTTVQTFGLNDRMQMTSQELKRGSETLQKYNYGYGQLDGSGNLDPTKNNGQLSQIESWIGTAMQWTKKFKYDQLGRLSEEKELRGDNAAQVYKNVYDFDRFGNMYRKAANNGSALAFTAIEDSQISKVTNRFASSTTYDDSGAVTQDNKFRQMDYGYDANGRMVNAKPIEKPDFDLSVYDASGMRVAERVNDVWSFHIYDISGNLVADYGGVQSADEGGVKYLLSDWQGSTRAVLSNGGFVNGRVDYTAYGEEIGAGTGQRTYAQGFGNTSTYLRQKYGLTEKDSSTGLDHADWRKHENRAGRWTSADPYGGSMSIGAPQSFNRFSYVSGQPTNFVDPSGLFISGPNTQYGNGVQGYGVFSGGLAAFAYFLSQALNNVSFSINYTMSADGTLSTNFNISVPSYNPTTIWLISGGGGGGGIWSGPTNDDSGGGGGIFPQISRHPISHDNSQQDDYNACVRNKILESMQRSLTAGAKMYAGASLMAAASAGIAWAARSGARHTGSAFSQPNSLPFGNVINGLAAPGDAGRLAGIGGVAYWAGANLFSQGVDTTRLNASATQMAIRHCKSLFPNSK